MGKPFHHEIQRLSETYQWALRQDLFPIIDSLRPLWGYPLLAIGSGGSLSAAHLAATLHENRTRNLSSVCTPLEFLTRSQAGLSAGVLILSAGGRNPDVLGALRQAVQAEPPWTTVVCGTRSTPLGKLAKFNEFGALFEYSLPSGKDGFLATNSLLAVSTFLVRAYANPGDDIPETLEQLLKAPDLNAFVERITSGDIDKLVKRETVIVLHGANTRGAAVDVESKLTEAALARVQVADYRNFAHGRHHWLAKHADESSVLAFCTVEDRDLCSRTLALLPDDVPKVRADLPGSPGEQPLQGLLLAIALTDRFGQARGIDPGRPSVPEFGKRLYHLRTRRTKEANSVKTAIGRKLRAAQIPAGRVDQQFWLACLEAQFAIFRDHPFSGLIFDYDGTLCSSHRRLEGPDEEMAAQIIKLLDKGIVIGIATGRGRSVRKDLQKLLPREHWESILIGYYNASDITILADEDAPVRSETLVEALNAPYHTLQSDEILRETCCWTLRPRQITIEPRSWLSGYQLWKRANECLQRLPSSGVRVVSSTHSIDIIAPDVSKINLMEALISDSTISSKDQILCIGDLGRWPGNDYELLAHKFSLSADEVSGDPHRGWNLAPAGCRGTQATLYYLNNSEIAPRNFQLRLEEARK